MSTSSQITIVSFGIAKDILREKTKLLTVKSGTSIRDLREELEKSFPDFLRLRYLKFAVNDEYVSDDRVISNDDVIYLIPPVSGG